MELPVNYNKLKPHERCEVREQYIVRQQGLCYYCKNPLTVEPARKALDNWIYRRLFPPGFFDNPVHLHHDHNTGLTIGAVHAYCNAVLWQYHGE